MRATETLFIVPALGLASLTLAHASQPSWVDTVQAWAAAVRQHEPGDKDAPLLTVASWPGTELWSVIVDLRALLGAKAGPRGDVRHKDLRLSLPKIAGLLGLGATTDSFERDANLLRYRGALLHADIAILAPEEARHAVAPRSLSARGVIDVGDSGSGAYRSAALHWDLARALLDGVTPTPGGDATVKLWYRAVAAYLVREHLLGEVIPHLDRARQLFPDDPPLLLLSGATHEALAGPVMQGAAKTVVLPRGFRLRLSGAATERDRAVRDLRRALAGDARLTEARVRLGRVLGLDGEHRAAEAELRRATDEATSPLLQYYAALFRGEELRALNRRAEARKSFERAAALYPGAQSPRLSLALLARASGDRTQAVRNLRDVLRPPLDDPSREEPWWTYHSVAGLAADAWLDDLRRQFRRRTSP